MSYYVVFMMALMNVCSVVDAGQSIKKSMPEPETIRVQDNQTAEQTRLLQELLEANKQTAESVKLLTQLMLLIMEKQNEQEQLELEFQEQKSLRRTEMMRKESERPWYKKVADGTTSFTINTLIPGVKHQLVYMLIHKVTRETLGATDYVTADLTARIILKLFDKEVELPRPGEWLRDMSKEQCFEAQLQRQAKRDPECKALHQEINKFRKGDFLDSQRDKLTAERNKLKEEVEVENRHEERKRHAREAAQRAKILVRGESDVD